MDRTHASMSSPKASPAASGKASTDASADERPLILLIDDERSVRRTVKLILETLGYSCVVAEDGLEGVERFQEHHETIAAVLLDMVMPRMSGAQAFMKMKEINPGVPIIVCSGYAPGDDLRILEREGLAAFLSKPYHRTQLRDALVEVLS